MLDDTMAEFLMTALALNRTVIVSANQLDSAQTLAEALVDASWQDERVVVIDPSAQMNALSQLPHLNQSHDINELCHHASMLKAQHLVFNGVCGTELEPILKASKRVKGGTILIVKSFQAALTFDMLSGGLTLATAGSSDDAVAYLKEHVDVIAHLTVDAKHVARLEEVIDTNGDQTVLFSTRDGVNTSEEAPAWFSQAARDGYEVNLALFK